MSSPAQQLPARAHLEFLRKEARDLHHAFQAGDADAVERISDFLPRAGGLSTEDLADIKLSRQEAQHALACSYGFHKWDELIAAAPGSDARDTDLEGAQGSGASGLSFSTDFDAENDIATWSDLTSAHRIENGRLFVSGETQFVSLIVTGERFSNGAVSVQTEWISGAGSAYGIILRHGRNTSGGDFYGFGITADGFYYF